MREALRPRRGQLSLVRCLVVAGGAAGFAVQEAVVAQADVERCLAEAAEFFTLTRSFELLTLSAFVLGGTGSVAHESNVARRTSSRKMTLVIVMAAERPHPARLPQRNDFEVAYNSQQ